MTQKIFEDKKLQWNDTIKNLLMTQLQDIQYFIQMFNLAIKIKDIQTEWQLQPFSIWAWASVLSKHKTISEHF